MAFDPDDIQAEYAESCRADRWSRSLGEVIELGGFSVWTKREPKPRKPRNPAKTHKVYWSEVKADPVRHAAYLAKSRKRHSTAKYRAKQTRYIERVKADPVRLAAYRARTQANGLKQAAKRRAKLALTASKEPHHDDTP